MLIVAFGGPKRYKDKPGSGNRSRAPRKSVPRPGSGNRSGLPRGGRIPSRNKREYKYIVSWEKSQEVDEQLMSFLKRYGMTLRPTKPHSLYSIGFDHVVWWSSQSLPIVRRELRFRFGDRVQVTDTGITDERK